MDTINCVQNAIDFIEDNIVSELSTDVIAGQAFMSSYHFQRVFAAICGMPLGEYIRNRRLSLAGADVENGSMKIIDIAFKYGYESPESFSRAFSRFHGVSPMAARSQKGKIAEFARISVKSIIGGNQMLQGFKERGYMVQENAPIYYTDNMDRTAKWFEDILGWYAGIDERDEQGNGTYGCVLPIPGEIKNMTLVPFNGFHMFRGEPAKRTVGFMKVDSIANLRAFVMKSGWTKLGDIEAQPWGARECDVTTIDGCIIRFFQLD